MSKEGKIEMKEVTLESTMKESTNEFTIKPMREQNTKRRQKKS